MKLSRLIPSTIIGAATFTLFFSFFEVTIPLSLLFGFAGLIGGMLLFSPKNVDPRFFEIEKKYGISEAKLKKIISVGKKKLRKLKKISGTIKEESIQLKIEGIVEVVEKIFQDFREDPKDIKAARQFLNYNLDATIKIIGQYAILSEIKTSKNRISTLKKVETMLDTIKESFENQLHKLYEDDFLDLDTEISVLEKTIKLER